MKKLLLILVLFSVQGHASDGAAWSVKVLKSTTRDKKASVSGYIDCMQETEGRCTQYQFRKVNDKTAREISVSDPMTRSQAEEMVKRTSKWVNGKLSILDYVPGSATGLAVCIAAGFGGTAIGATLCLVGFPLGVLFDVVISPVNLPFQAIRSGLLKLKGKRLKKRLLEALDGKQKRVTKVKPTDFKGMLRFQSNWLP